MPNPDAPLTGHGINYLMLEQQTWSRPGNLKDGEPLSAPVMLHSNYLGWGQLWRADGQMKQSTEICALVVRVGVRVQSDIDFVFWQWCARNTYMSNFLRPLRPRAWDCWVRQPTKQQPTNQQTNTPTNQPASKSIEKFMTNQSKFDLKSINKSSKSIKNRTKWVQNWSWRLSWGIWGPSQPQDPKMDQTTNIFHTSFSPFWRPCWAFWGPCWGYVGAPLQQTGNQNAILSNMKLQEEKESPKMRNIAQHDTNLAQHGLHLGPSWLHFGVKLAPSWQFCKTSCLLYAIWPTQKKPKKNKQFCLMILSTSSPQDGLSWDQIRTFSYQLGPTSPLQANLTPTLTNLNEYRTNLAQLGPKLDPSWP